MKITAEQYNEKITFELPDDLTAVELLKNLRYLMLALSYAPGSVHNAFEEVVEEYAFEEESIPEFVLHTGPDVIYDEASSFAHTIKHR